MSTTKDVRILGGAKTQYRRGTDGSISEHRNAIDVARAAVASAGIDMSAIDGMVTYSQEYVPETELVRALGTGSLRFLARTPYGGGGVAATVALAAMAIRSGEAEAVLCYRSTNGYSGPRKGRGDAFKDPSGPSALELDWHRSAGLRTPPSWAALLSTRYMQESGADESDIGRIAVAARRTASTNPRAVFHGSAVPTLDDYMADALVATPLRRMDCCVESDGAAALVVTSDAVSGSSGVKVVAATSSMSPWQRHMTNFYEPDALELPEVRDAATRLWQRSGLSPENIDVAVVYDHFTPFVPMQLEAFGFCDRGEGFAYLRDQSADRPVINPHGGQLAEGYVQGLNGIVEAFEQLTGTAANQVDHPKTALATGGGGIPTSSLLLSA